MLLKDLDYSFPPELTAREPRRPSRVAFSAAGARPCELNVTQLLERVGPNDLFVVNETKVVPARVFTADGTEILFLKPVDGETWEVLFPARDFHVGDELLLPDRTRAVLTRKGLPQHLKIEPALDAAYFERHGEMALPPYIQDARGERHNRPTDARWYQTAWARQPGSVAAPTASLHFSAAELARVPNLAKLTLHVGAGTFFPVRTADLAQHEMHAERIEIPRAVQAQVQACRGRVWALGTTVARALESMDQLEIHGDTLRGETKLFVYPPYQFKHVDVLLTNFHQPKSTLLALVAAFAGMERVREMYAWAIANRFQLFSYGDLSAWTR